MAKKGKKGGKSVNRTNKTILSRVRITRKGKKKKSTNAQGQTVTHSPKVMAQAGGKAHFNSRGNRKQREKRKDVSVSTTVTRTIQRAIGKNS